MSTTNTGGSAFPQNTKIVLGAGQEIHQGFMGGMSLRDYFAAHAPNPPETWKAEKDEAANIIVWRWAYADEMISAREAV